MGSKGGQVVRGEQRSEGGITGTAWAVVSEGVSRGHAGVPRPLSLLLLLLLPLLPRLGLSLQF